MKKLLILTAFLFSVIISFAQNQYPNIGTGVSNDSTLYLIKGGTKFKDGSIVTNYIDTASANLKHIAFNSGAQIFVNDTIWVRNISATAWIPIGTGIVKGDTLFAQLPAFFDSTTRSPNTILKILQGDGFTPGIVTWDSLLVFSVSPSSITLSNKTWNFPATTLTLSPADPTYSRYDLFGIDTSGPFVLKGIPSPSPTIPQVGVDSFALTSGFLINPGDTVPSGVSITTIYNENLGYPQEWLAQFSNGTADYNNTDNPYSLVKDGFISKYNNGQIRFLDYNGTYIRNTPVTGEVLKIPIYINGAFTNSIYAKFYDSSSTSTNNLLITQPSFGFNPNDSNVYQVLTIPLSSFTWKNTGKFTTLALIMTGVDTSGAKGFYIDYVTLQNGINNIPPPTDYSNKQDSNILVKTTVGSDTLNVINWWVKGIPHALAPIYTHSGGGTTERFGIEDSTGIHNRYINMQGDQFEFYNPNNFNIYNNTTGGGAGAFDLAYGDADNYIDRTTELFLNDRVVYMYAQGFNGTNYRSLTIDSTTATVQRGGAGQDGVQHEIAVSVNGTFADNTGNITISTGGTGGISKLGSPTYGLIKVNDSTYKADSSVHATSSNTGFVSNIDWAAFHNKTDSVSSNAGGDSLVVIKNTSRLAYKYPAGNAGTVTSISQGYGIVNTPNPIVSTGTIKADSATLSNYYVRRKDSVATGYYPYSSNPLGYLTSIDTTNIPNFSVKVRSLFSATAPITYNSATGLIGITQATTSTNGYLSSTDWNAFHVKVDSLTKNSTHDSFYVWTNGSHVALKDSVGATGTLLNGTGYVQMSGTTANYVTSPKDSSAYHTVTTVSDSSLAICDLKGRCDTIVLSVFENWKKLGSNLYYNQGNVGIGNSNPKSGLAISRNFNNLNPNDTTYGGLVLRNDSIVGTTTNTLSPSLVFQHYEGASGNNYDYRWRVYNDLSLNLKFDRGFAVYPTPPSYTNIAYLAADVLGGKWVMGAGSTYGYTANIVSSCTAGGFIGGNLSLSASTSFSTATINSANILSIGGSTTNSGSSINTYNAEIISPTNIANLGGTNYYNAFYFKPLISNSGGTNKISGFRFQPTNTSLTGTTVWAFTNTTGDNYFNSISGSTGIGVDTGTAINSTLQVKGSIATALVAKTANYTATTNDYTIVFTSNTDTLTLPTAVGITGRIYVYKNLTGNNGVVATTSLQTIDGNAAPLTAIADKKSYQFQSDGANWIIISTF